MLKIFPKRRVLGSQWMLRQMHQCFMLVIAAVPAEIMSQKYGYPIALMLLFELPAFMCLAWLIYYDLHISELQTSPQLTAGGVAFLVCVLAFVANAWLGSTGGQRLGWLIMKVNVSGLLCGTLLFACLSTIGHHDD